MPAIIEKIHYYPVKGLSAQELPAVDLIPGEGLPQDRRFAITHGATTFSSEAPEWKPKTNFITLMRNERLATLQTDYDPETTALTIRRGPRVVARGQIDTPTGRVLIEQFLSAYLKGEAPGTPRVVEAPGHAFFDAKDKYISLINMASVQDLERVVQSPVNPVRFRGNFLFSGEAPWVEFGWIDRFLTIGAMRCEVVKRIDRCPATNVDPLTGARDLNIPRALQRGYGHIDFGVYARVVTSGRVTVGDALVVE
ncbi:Molybdenum cofactor sulfurase [Azospirillaceae bacterium]